MRHREPLSPEAVRDLEAIDRALAGEPVEYELREIEDLVRDVRASAPEMSPALTARLEREIESGFASTPSSVSEPKRTWALPRLRVLVPAAGTVAAVLVALVLVTGPGGGSDEGAVVNASRETTKPTAPASDPPNADTATADPSFQKDLERSSGGAAATGSAGVVPDPDAVLASRNRKVERRVSLVLQTERGKVASTADDVIGTVDRFRGIVASSSISSDDQSSEAVFDLRIPTAKLDAALAALSKLGHVAERRQDLQDITSSVSSARERRDDARAERRGLLRALGRATTQAQIESLRARLRLVRSQISSAQAQLSSLNRRASLSTVSVTVRGDGKPGEGGGAWSLGDAGGDAVRALEVIAGVALITLAVALPLALLGGVILFGSHLARARRRENALDAT